MRERIFSLGFLALLAAVGLIDTVNHGIKLVVDPRRESGRDGWDSAGAALGPLRSNLDREMSEQGDLSRISRLLPFRKEYRIRMKTDPFGFWNPDYADDAHYDAVILGDCFLDGDDGEMLHQYLAEVSGLRVYNYHGMKNLGMKPKTFLADRRFLAAPPRFLIVERIERGFDARWIQDLLEDFPPRREAQAPAWRRKSDVSGHSLIAEWGQWAVATARYRVLGRLPSATPLQAPSLGMLFFHEEVEAHSRTPEERGLPEVLDGLDSLNRLCRARGITLAVLMTPDKYTVYGGLAPERPEDKGPAFREALFKGLRERHIPAVDLFPVFQARAGRADSLLYYANDTRWTPLGRRLAADETWRALRQEGAGVPQAFFSSPAR